MLASTIYLMVAVKLVEQFFALYWNSSKIKRVVRSTIAAEMLALSDGCDVAIYINRLVSLVIL